MRVVEVIGTFGLSVALGLVGTGCVVDNSAPECVGQGCYVGAGDVILSWSIDGDGSGALCASHDAAQIEVKIVDVNNNPVDDWQLPCTTGGADETLPAGDYTATAQLEDASGKPITTADPSQIAIYAGYSSVPLDFDFEEDSFTNGT
jgi:hypothetical protein